MEPIELPFSLDSLVQSGGCLWLLRRCEATTDAWVTLFMATLLDFYCCVEQQAAMVVKTTMASDGNMKLFSWVLMFVSIGEEL